MADPNTGRLAIQICPGYALGPCGDEIYIPEPLNVQETRTDACLSLAQTEPLLEQLAAAQRARG